MKTVTLLLIGVAFLTSCAKQESSENENEKQPIVTTAHGPLLHFEGRIHWGGDISYDGTGWSFVPSGTNNHYYLKGLPQAFMADQLKVSISLQETTEKAPCFCPDPPFLYAMMRIERK